MLWNRFQIWTQGQLFQSRISRLHQPSVQRVLILWVIEDRVNTSGNCVQTYKTRRNAAKHTEYR